MPRPRRESKRRSPVRNASDRPNAGCSSHYRGEKALLAPLLRKLTSVSRDLVAERLSMGHPTSVSRAAASVRSEAGLAKRGKEFDKRVLQEFTD